MSNSNFDFISFGEGVQRINAAIGKSRGSRSLEETRRVITSRDDDSAELRNLLAVQGVPSGITKWQLPVYWEGTGAQFFVSVAEPGTKIEEHSHVEGDGIRFVVGGAIDFQEQRLSSGDWMFIPKGVSYSITASEQGAIMCYCYACCCAIRQR